MFSTLKQKTYNFLKWTEKWTKTDMIYLAKGGFWLSLGQAVSSISAFLLAIAFANFLPQETYGQYKYILSIAGLLAIPTLSGMNTALVQAVARGYEGSIVPAFKTKVRWGLLGGLAGIVLAGYYFFQGNTTLSIAFLITAIFVPFMDPLGVYGAYFSGRKMFKQSTRLSVITKIIATAIMATTVYLSNNIFLIILSYFAANTALRLFFFRLTLYKQNSLNKKEDPETIPYGKHLSFISIISTISFQIEKILLFHYYGAAQLAIYSISVAMPEQIKGALKLISPLALPKFSQRSNAIIKKTIVRKTIVFAIGILFLTALYILTAPIIYKYLFPQYQESILYSQIFSLSIISAAGMLPLAALNAKMSKKQLYMFNTIGPIFQVLLFLILIKFSIMGIILARLIYRILNVFFVIFLIKKT